MTASAPLDRLNAALEDRYRVERPLGEGGMATVYLARDLKHDREVAIKVLKPELAAVIGGERFVAEIRTTAQLQHPHILPLFDSGAAEGFLYYVMPFVEGESLREKLDRERQLAVDESVRIAEAVASALQYAHDQGVVHRDIKPANILIHAGEPVVADFGIALAISAAGGGRLTETGMSLGTPHYMSPEQASADREVTARSDLYSLACVLYEMLTGDPPHTGPTAQAVLMRILTEDPRDVTDVRKAVPGNVRDALARALEKLPADRFRDAGEFKRALTDPDFTYRPVPSPGAGAGRVPGTDAREPGRTRDTGTRLLLGATVVLLGTTVLLTAALAWSLTRGDGGGAAGLGTGPAHRYVIADSLRSNLVVAISRRGDVAYPGTVDGRQHIRLRPARDTLVREVPGTEGGDFPVFSPDGEWLAFGRPDQGDLRKVQLATGTVVTLVPSGRFEQVFPSQWSDDGTIVFTSLQGIYRVPDVGGVPEQLAEQASPVLARILPGGRTLVSTVLPQGDPAGARVVATDLETGDTATVVESGGNAVWSPTGHLLHGHPSGTVFALPFDPDRGVPTGPPVPVRESVLTLGAVSFFDVSPTGSMVFVGGGTTGADIASQALAWMDLSGTVTSIPMEPTDHADIRLSPDGGHVAYTRGGQIHLFDLNLGTDQRLTFEGTNHHDPVWSPDGSRVAFSSDREGGQGGVDIWVKDVDGQSPAEWVAGTEEQDYAAQWLNDGTLVYYHRTLGASEADIATASVDDPDAGSTPLLEADWDEAFPAVSPDGTLLAYVSDETGERHVFVRRFPGMAGRWQVSDDPVFLRGAALAIPIWSADGAALYYQRMPDHAVVRVDVQREPTFRVVAHTEVTEGGGAPTLLEDLHPDGDRFLVSRPLGAEALAGAEPRVTVVANWLTELRERLGGGS